ncbi:MAG: hypothetical protein COY40_01010 [Alphaproteobacteria bacterium CG_4_10_14_0_8_um_filter_53_9]|nr:MAG: hypothetical protein COY40_01010 [Alphaproteobacteria bacterium CG_4_10_14_0_8_um_filter_53_9]
MRYLFALFMVFMASPAVLAVAERAPPALPTAHDARFKDVVTAWAAGDGVSRVALLRTALRETPWHALHLMSDADDTHRLALLDDLLVILNEDTLRNAPVLSALMQAYGDMIAARAAAVAPAAGAGEVEAFSPLAFHKKTPADDTVSLIMGPAAASPEVPAFK